MANATADAPVRANKAAPKAKASPSPAAVLQKPTAPAPVEVAPQATQGGLTTDEQLVATTLRQQLMAICGTNKADLHGNSVELVHAAAEALDAPPEAFVALYRARCLVAGAIAVEQTQGSLHEVSILHLQAVHQSLDSACLSYNVEMEPSESMAEGIRAGMRQQVAQPAQPIRRAGEASNASYTTQQFRSILTEIASVALSLDRVLMIAQQAEEGYDTNVLLDTAEVLARQLGGMADSAIGGQIYGTFETWHYGPNFADPGKAGAA